MNIISRFTRKKVSFLVTFCFLFSNLFSQSAFIENKGQWDNNILFQSDFASGKLYIEKEALNYNFFDLDEYAEHINHQHKTTTYERPLYKNIKGHCIKTRFLNASFSEKVEKINPLNEYFNYYIGNDPKQWASHVNAYQEVHFNTIYPHIDLHFKTSESGYKYDFILNPKANIADIQIKYDGADAIYLAHENLYIKTTVNELIELKPYAYQLIDNKKNEVACRFVIENDVVHFELLDTYQKDKPLIIDPFIVFSRYSGSFADNFGYTATYDSEENAYGAGSVFGVGYVTTPGAFDVSFNGANTDIGIVKYSSNGLQRLYSTYLGGNNTDLPHSIVVNSRDELFLLGTTSSTNFPIDTFSTAYQSLFTGGNAITFNGLGVSYQNGSDLILARFAEDGTNLLASTYLGGTNNDGLNNSNFLRYNYADEIRGEVLIDENDNCFVVSCTQSTDFPIVNGFQANNAGGLDAVVIKIDENLTQILWSTYLGGSSDDAVYSIDFDSLNHVVLAGGTHSDDFPVVNPFQANFGGANADGFIAKLHNTGASLLNSTYYGSTDYDQIYFVELNDADEVHIFGQTKAPSNALINNALYNKPSGGQLLAKFNHTINNLIWSTRFGDGGGVPDISPTAFLVDVCNRIFLSGWGWDSDSFLSGTSGLDVTSDALDATTDNRDFYFMVLQDDASSLIYGSFFGGNFSREHVDGGTSRFDKKGVVYQAVCAGCGSNQDFPTVPTDSIGTWTNNSNNCNLGVVKYAFSPPSIIADFNLPPAGCAPISLNFLNQSQTAFNDTSQATFFWIVNNDTIQSYHLNYNFPASGVYTITLWAIDTQSCNFQNSITKQITIIGNGYNFLPDVTICTGNTAQIGFTPLQGQNINYQWSPDYFLSTTNISNPFANPPSDTTYQLIVSSLNCVDTFVQNVVLESVTIQIEPFDSVCLEGEITLNATFIPGATYLWQPEEIVLLGQGSASATIYAQNINQSVSVTITTVEFCTATVSTQLQTINNLPDLALFAEPDTIEATENVQLTAISETATSFTWLANNYFNTLTDYTPIAEKILETTTFTAIADNGICPKRDSVTVYVVIPDCLDGKFYVPNAFSPNNDGNNDIFKVNTTLVNIENFYFAVYDRLGNKVYSTTNKLEGWNGIYKGKEMTPNVYGWYVEGICPNGEAFFLKGNVTLLK